MTPRSSSGIEVDGISSAPYNQDEGQWALTIQPLIKLKYDHECVAPGACNNPRFPGLVWSSVMGQVR